MGSFSGVGLAAERLERLFELFVRAEVEIEKEELSALQLAAAPAAAGQPLLANRIAQPRGQIERLLQQLYRVHPSFSKSPTSRGLALADYSGLHYSWRAEFDDTANEISAFGHLKLKHAVSGRERERRYWGDRANAAFCVNLRFLQNIGN